ncbi:XdhC family protein [Paenibacillus sp. BSR1-1]|uniref:XdhC family protein n=1 Tax=Paenibacillus sp. BSR1-1 TaxID=3020845 RepID=UPI0025B1C3EC|nr:XdhC family protein [Paenibacillus sp. BSR1-1]MDN3015238.1 XdhC family protein [Paenibacillus sp. BSR1-1]
MEDIFLILDAIKGSGKKVLATIIRVNGSAYKKEGASMLFFEDGSQIGLLSAGCLETDLAVRVQEVFEKQRAFTLHYDMSDEKDIGWGQGSGCNGTIDILLEPVTTQLQKDLILVREELENNTPVTVLKNLSNVGEYVFLTKEGRRFGQWSGVIPKVEIQGKSGVTDGLPIYQETYQPKPRLIVFGAGPDARPLVSLAAETGFSVTICDWRNEFCQKKYFPGADRLLLGFPSELLKEISFTPYDFVIIMTHHFQKDQEILLSIFNKNVRYLGILGPKERTKRLLRNEEIPKWLHSPIGLAIGSRGSVEIAVSIVAEMIEVLRKPVRKKVELLWTVPD